MNSDLLSLLQSTLSKTVPLLLSFADDLLIFGLTQIGVHLPWLSVLSTCLLTATILYWSFRLLRFLYQKSSIN